MQYDAVAQAARLNATRLLFVNGTLEILSAADAVLVIYTFSATAGTVSTDTWTLAFVSTAGVGTAAAGAGVNATKARFKVSGGTVRLDELTAGVATGVPATEPDITLDNVNIAEDQVVNLVGAATITHA